MIAWHPSRESNWVPAAVSIRSSSLSSGSLRPSVPYAKVLRHIEKRHRLAVPLIWQRIELKLNRLALRQKSDAHHALAGWLR